MRVIVILGISAVLGLSACAVEDTQPAIGDSAPFAAAREDAKAPYERATMGDDEKVIYRRSVTLSEGELSELVKKSAETLAMLAQGEGRAIPAEALARAKCVAVFPNVTKAALLVGGRHGDGVATCRGENNHWSSLGFLDLSGGSFGAQLGGSSTALALLFMNDDARRQLESGKAALGAELSVSFGPKEETEKLDISSSDVLAYGQTSGAFAGASLEGTVITADEDELKAFYDENARYSRIISTYDAPNHPMVIKDFIQLLPKE